MKLNEAINVYVTQKQTTGLRYTQAKKRFVKFGKYMGDLELNEIRTEDIAIFLGTPHPNTPTWHSNYLRLQRFFVYWTVRDAMSPLEMPPRPKQSRNISHSYIYSLVEIRRLLDAVYACQSQASCSVDAGTLRMYLILLYATGTTPSELLDLRRENVDLKKKILCVHNRKYDCGRHVPIGEDLKALLRSFLKRTCIARSGSDPLFADKSGAFIQPAQVTYSFKRLRKLAKVGCRLGMAPQPRLLDFRITFAVHRITQWMDESADLNCMLPALAAYMGQFGLGSIDRYLDLTPERFKTHLSALGSGRSFKLWIHDERPLTAGGSARK